MHRLNILKWQLEFWYRDINTCTLDLHISITVAPFTINFLLHFSSTQACKEIEGLHLDSTITDHSTTATPNGTSHHPHMQQHHHHQQPTRRRNSLEQEVDLLREENDSLNNTLRTKEEELHKMKGNLITIRDDRDKLRKRVRECVLLPVLEFSWDAKLPLSWGAIPSSWGAMFRCFNHST